MERNKMDKNTTMENLARALQEKDGFNGAWLYAENGEIVSKGALGFRDPENTLPITEDTIFQLASISKQFTATAVMLLMRQSLLSPEDRITKYFPELAAYEGVTVRHLLNHTSGIPDYFDDADWFIKIWKEENGSRATTKSSVFSLKPKRNHTSHRGKDCVTPIPAITCWLCLWSGSPAFLSRNFCKRTSLSLPG
jgi:CubicO group peptidase (beta-lactamase class C family)